MNSSKSLVFILLILAISCKSDKEIAEPMSSKILQNFNELAKESFLYNYDSYDLNPLGSRDKTDLKEEIENNIDHSNNWALEVVDSFYIRNYYGDPMATHYSFVSNKSGKFYFIYLPHFYNSWLQDSLYNLNYEYDNLNPMELKDSVNYSIISLNSPMMDIFFNAEVFDPKRNVSMQIDQADHLIHKVFPYLFHNTETFRSLELTGLLEELDNYPKKNLSYIMDVLNPILIHPNYRIASNIFGIIIFSYSLDERISNKAKLSIYFIPRRHRPAIMSL